MKTYLAVAAGMPLLLVGGVAGTNYLLDPYLIHQWQTPQVQRLRQPVEKLSAWGKTYAVAVYRPQTVYLGNSRTELGLAVPRQAARRVFNAALSGGTAGDAMRMFAHARQVASIEQVVWGIDAPSFTLSAGNPELENGVLAQGGGYLARRVLFDMQRAVSIDMSRDAWAMVGGAVPAVCRPSLAQFGQRDGACLRYRLDGWGGASAVLGLRTREFLRGEGPTPGTIEALERTMRRACDVQWRLYINPTHAMTIDVLYWSGRGAQYEDWLGRLAAMGRRVRAAGCDARIYDFSGFNSITGEAVPRPGDRSEMRNYWETSHYREQVGAAILARLAGAPAAGDGFGAELLPETMAARILQLRATRAGYLAAHPYEAGLAHRIALDQALGR
jgi:hypothetical protein